MRVKSLFLLILVLPVCAFGQRPTDILATTTLKPFRVGDLSAEAQAALAQVPADTARIRSALLDQVLNAQAADIEARTRGISAGKLVALEKAKVPQPSEAEIKAVYDANRDEIGSMSLEQARPQLVAYLRSQPEQKLLNDLFTQLRTKYKVALGKDVNAPNLLPTDVVGTVNGKPVTAKQFEDLVRHELFDLRADLADFILAELDEAIYAAVVAEEARVSGIDSGTLIAQEITNKLKDFSDEERGTLEAAFRKRLWTKYQVKVLYKAPVPPVQVISLDDDPAQGPIAAPVKIVMFSDFQCSACAAVYPMLKQAIAAYPGRIRLVVRDFPLESIHPEAFDAARAAAAANAQGKFFEYTELLYKNQAALDAASLRKYAAQIGLNAAKFEIDFNSAATAAEVRKDMADGDSYGVTSTPTIFVNGVRVRNFSVDDLRAAIERALRPGP